MSKKVGLSPGHEEDTPGKRTPDGYNEYSFNKPTADFATMELQRCGIEVVNCNPAGYTSLHERAQIANRKRVDCFVAIHYNAFNGKWGNWGGIETYCHPQAPKQGGKLLARCLQDELVKGTKLKDRGVKEANFFVLRETKCPAALAECGYMDNKKEAALMKTTAYQQECGIEIAKGVCKYLNVKYVPPKVPETIEKWREILKSKSDWAETTWVPFISKHHSKYLNLKGLIEVLAEENPDRLKEINVLKNENKQLKELISKVLNILK